MVNKIEPIAKPAANNSMIPRSMFLISRFHIVNPTYVCAASRSATLNDSAAGRPRAMKRKTKKDSTCAAKRLLTTLFCLMASTRPTYSTDEYPVKDQSLRRKRLVNAAQLTQTDVFFSSFRSTITRISTRRNWTIWAIIFPIKRLIGRRVG